MHLELTVLLTLLPTRRTTHATRFVTYPRILCRQSDLVRIETYPLRGDLLNTNITSLFSALRPRRHHPCREHHKMGRRMDVCFDYRLFQYDCRHKHYRCLLLTITLLLIAYATGLALRYLVHTNPDSIGIYIAMYSFVTLSVCPYLLT